MDSMKFIKNPINIIIFIVAFSAFITLQIFLGNSYVKKANQALSDNSLKQAMINLEKASLLLPTNENIRIAKAKIYLTENNLLSAEKELKKAVKIKKNNVNANIKLLEVLFYQGKLQEAKKYVEKASKKVKSNENFKIFSAKIYASSGNMNKAFSLLAEETIDFAYYRSILLIAEEKYGDAENLLKNHGNEIQNKQKKYSVILNALDKVNNNENKDYKMLITGQLLNELNEPYLAERILNKINDKTLRDFYIYKSYAKYLINDLKQAEDLINQAIEKDPVYGLSYYFKGMIYAKMGLFEKSNDFFQKAYDYNYKNAEQYIKK